MDNLMIAARLLAAMVALPIIICGGGRGESAQTIVYISATVTETAQPVQCCAASNCVLGDSGLWSNDDDRSTSGPDPLRGMRATSQYVPNQVNSDPNATQAVQSFDVGTVQVMSSDDTPCCGSAPDYVMLKDSGAVSGEWFQSNSRAGPK